MRIACAKVAAIILLIVCLPQPAFSMSWRATTRADWRSLDCLKRRLQLIVRDSEDPVIVENARRALMHVSPMLKRHGGKIPEHKQIVLNSEDGELALILIHNGYANSGAHWADLRGEAWDNTGGRLWRWIVRIFWTSLFWIVVTGALWLWILKRGKLLKMRDEETIATHRAIERAHPDKAERSTTFNDPLTARAHRRVKKLLEI